VEAELKTKYPDSKVKLIEGGGGIFEVTCNGTLIFSKQTIEGQRFPHDGEISWLIDKEIS
jgi:selT/selW/selH-like putative selenoprotein